MARWPAGAVCHTHRCAQRGRGHCVSGTEPGQQSERGREYFFSINPPQRWGIVDHKVVQRQAQALLEELGIRIPASASVASLSMAQRQLVEIAKALSTPARVVIMDEPTSSLSDNEAEILFNIIQRLTAQGKAVVYISHRMEEILRISDDISVMRDGEYICTVEKGAASIEQLITLMVGRPLDDIYPPRFAAATPARKPAFAGSA